MRRDNELTFNANDLTAEDVIASLQGFEVYTAFGEAFQYSNQMVATGGYVAAAAAGGRYGELGEAYARELQERVLDPIGMTRTKLSIADVEADDDHATPHGLRLDYTYLPMPPQMIGLHALAPACGDLVECERDGAIPLDRAEPRRSPGRNARRLGRELGGDLAAASSDRCGKGLRPRVGCR